MASLSPSLTREFSDSVLFLLKIMDLGGNREAFFKTREPQQPMQCCIQSCKRVTSCGSHQYKSQWKERTHLLISFQLIVGILIAMGMCMVSSLSLSEPLMKQGFLSRQNNPSAHSVNRGNN